jgi:hypothetical protein
METAQRFQHFGGLRLDLPIDEVGPEDAIYLRDVDWDGSLGKVRCRDGFQKLKAAEATGPYKGLFPHSALRMLATKRISGTEAKIVALDKEGTEKTEAVWPATEGKSSFTHLGTTTASYTFGRANVSTAKVVRFDGATFTEPLAKAGAYEGEHIAGTQTKEMPKGALYATWPAGGNRLIAANTAAAGGPGGFASSNSHVWFSLPGAPEEWGEKDFVILGAGDGEEITALCAWNGQIFVFKETKIFIFFSVSLDEENLPEFNFKEVSLGEGSRMKRASSSLQAETSDQIATGSPTGVYFCTTDGIYVTTGGQASKISQALKPLEETVPFDGPMAEFLNGSVEAFRWPATGIASLGQRIIVRRYEFMFIYDIPTAAWTCWKMPAVSMAIWAGLTGGGSEVQASRLPGTAEDKEGSGGKAWLNIENIKADDGSYARSQINVGEHSHFAVARNFGFTIPVGATIVGVAVAPRRRVQGTLVPHITDLEVRLLVGNTVVGENKAVGTAWPTTGTLIEYGGPEALWGLSSLTQANVTAAGFGAAIAAQCLSGKEGSAQIDAVYMAVYYLTPEAASGVRPRLFCTQGKSTFWTGPTAEEQATTRAAEWQPGWFDLGSDDEKTLTTTKLWGKGTVTFEVGTDYAALERPKALELGSSISREEFNRAQTGVLFTHRLKLGAGASVQRLTRYLRETEPPTTSAD